MIVDGKQLRTVEFIAEADALEIIDQTRLPHVLEMIRVSSLEQACHAIEAMQVRGAPLIGITAAFGLYFALREGLDRDLAVERLLATRPTAVNLRWALRRSQLATDAIDVAAVRYSKALAEARAMLEEDAAACSAIGDFGLELIEALWRSRQGSPGVDRLNILTHCNAGWLATADWGTALSPIYKAHERGIPVHVWVDETRPRNQGASLTAWELGRLGVPHTLIVDNAGGHLMQQGEVDICFVGSDRTAANGDVCNKIGTYLKALAAFDNNIPFYAALPVSTIDFELSSGVGNIPIEIRDGAEVHIVNGIDQSGTPRSVRVSPPTTDAINVGFDVTPARLISGLVTERGVFPASIDGLEALQRQFRD